MIDPVSPLAHSAAAPATPRAVDRVLCAVDGSPSSDDAVREAIVLAPCSSRLSFVTVVGTGAGAPGAHGVSLDERRARQTLERAQGLARSRGLDAEAELVHHADVAAALLARMDDDCLLVAGHHGNARATGIATSSVATALAHRASGPLLIARAGTVAEDLPRRMLVAVDDSDEADAVVQLAGSIAAGCGGYVHLVHVQGSGYGTATRHRLAELSTALIDLTGAEPAVDVLRGRHVAANIGAFAARCGSSLLVVGRRGLTGARSLGSVSERLVHTAPCSVLVVSQPHAR